MSLINLLRVIGDNTLVWISEDPESCEGIYCGCVGEITMGLLHKHSDYKVKCIYPEAYGAYYGRHGISIIIEKAV